MQFDKDKLVKHRFWVMLGVAAPLALVGVFVLLTSVSADIAARLNRVKAKEKEISGFKANDLVNARSIEAANTVATKAQDLQKVVWKEAYEVQEPLFSWPAAIEEKYNFRSGAFINGVTLLPLPASVKEWPEDKEGLVHGTFKEITDEYLVLQSREKQALRFFRSPKMKITSGEAALLFPEIASKKPGEKLFAVNYQVGKFLFDPLTQRELQEYAKKDVYKSQIYPILESVDPVTAEGKGVVQLGNWPYSRDTDPPTGQFFHWVTAPWVAINDFSNEAWLAQEDLWIQKEIYRLIRAANDSVSKFQGQGGSKPGTYQFTNPYFTLELKWTGGDKLQLKIGNRLKRRQKLDQDFLVHFREDDKLGPETIRVGGEPLEPVGSPKDSFTLNVELTKGVQRTGIYGVEQVLNWETAAVKRIDQLVFADPTALSHRDTPTILRGYVEAAKPEAAADPKDMKPGVPPLPGSGPAGVPPAPVMPGPGLPMGKVRPATATGMPPMERPRYVEKTAQVRRVPVAVVLIVDQDHVDRVQTAFINSRMRFRTKQVLVTHFPGSVRPQLGSAPADTQDLEANMELVIYGVISIYERYPPRPAETAATTTTP